MRRTCASKSMMPRRMRTARRLVRGHPTDRRLAPLALALLGGAAIASALWWVRVSTSRETPTPVHLSLTSVPRTSSSLYLNANHQVSISPDGRHIVFVANPSGHRQLFLRSMGEADARPIDGTDDARTAFFSSDGEWIAFGTGRALQKVAVSGGSPVTICKLSSTDSTEATGARTKSSSCPITTAACGACHRTEAHRNRSSKPTRNTTGWCTPTLRCFPTAGAFCSLSHPATPSPPMIRTSPF